MTSTTTRPSQPSAAAHTHQGWLARLGAWSGSHLRYVLIAWLLLLGVFGAFAPQVEKKLSGAGWQDSTSGSVKARDVINENFQGLSSSALQIVVHTKDGTIAQSQEAQQIVAEATAVLKKDDRISTVVPPQPGMSLSRDGKTGIIQAGAADDTHEMVRAAEDLEESLTELGTENVTVDVTGSSAMWANFNKVNLEAMLKSEVMSWPITMVVLLIAFGSLVAAGLPLMLTLAGLVTAAGALVISTQIAPVSIWAMNFAMMFALALGIDYALFLVVRFRAALQRRADMPDRKQASIDAIAETMGTAGKAVAFSGITVLVALSTVLLVPSPAFRSMSLGIMLSVVAVLAATLTLLPAVLGKLGTKIDAGKMRLPGAEKRAQAKAAKRAALAMETVQEHHDAHPHLHHSVAGLERGLHHFGAFLHKRPWISGGLVVVILGLLMLPLTSLRTGMPSIAVVPEDETARKGYVQVVESFGPGAPGMLSIVTPEAQTEQAVAVLKSEKGIAAVLPAGQNNGWTMTMAMPTTDASSRETGATIDRLQDNLPDGSLVGGAAAENRDLEKALSSRTPLVFGLLVVLGFLLLLVSLGSPLVAFVGVATNLLSIGAAFGVAKWIFQDGYLSDFLNFEPQGFVNAWGPLFFGAMLTGVAMDYTLFLLSAAREHYDLTGNPLHAMRMALRTSGRVVVAAAGVMVAVFLTFALSGPLAPKEMGIILAVAVFLDALLIRMILLPVVLRITGHGAWHRPAWLARILPEVRFSH